jgi:type II secretory pathway pseudopilin PulG
MRFSKPQTKAPQAIVHRGRAAAGEEGFVLIAVLFLMVLLLIALAVAAPKVAADIQRDREIELQHRGKQYQRAIQLYYRKFGAYPPNMEALVKINEIRFLRKRYKDPMTGKDEWHLIHFGEAKSPSLGFFGQPIPGTGGAGGSVLAGTGPGGVGQSIGSPIGGNSGSATSSGLTFGGSALPSTPTTTPTDTANVGGGTINGVNAATGTNGDPNAAGNAFGSNSASSFGTSGNNQSFGGGGIIGVESTSAKPSILEYKKKKHYNEWEFVYDPLTERTNAGGNAGTIGQPMGGAGNSGTSGFGSPSGTNNGQGAGGIGGGIGGAGGFGSPTPPTQPTTPQQ